MLEGTSSKSTPTGVVTMDATISSGFEEVPHCEFLSLVKGVKLVVISYSISFAIGSYLLLHKVLRFIKCKFFEAGFSFVEVVDQLGGPFEPFLLKV